MGVCSSKQSKPTAPQQDSTAQPKQLKRDTQASCELGTKRSHQSPGERRNNVMMDSQKTETRSRMRHLSSFGKVGNNIPTLPSILNSPLLETSASKKYTLIGYHQANHQISILQNNKTGVLVQMENIPKNDEKNEKYINWLQKTQLDHPNLLRIIEIHQDKGNYQVITEHFSGNPLSHLLLADNKVQKKTVSQILNQIVSAMSFLHSLDIIHGNLTLRSFEYIQTQSSLKVKLIDLKSTIIREENNIEIMKFLPPECLYRKNQFTFERDIWAIGLISIILRKGVFPYDIPANQPIDMMIVKMKEHNFSFAHKKDKVYRNFLESTLAAHPSHRKPLIELQKHQFLTTYKVNATTKQQILLNNFIIQKPCVKLQQLLLSFFSQEFDWDEYIAAQKLFSEGDSNMDGLLDCDEVEKLFSTYCAKDSYKKKQIKEMFTSTDGDEKLGLDSTEFLSMVVSRQNLLSQQNIEIAFQILSFNKQEIQLRGLKRHLQCEQIDIKQEFSDLTEDTNTLNFQQFDLMMKLLLQ